VVKPGLAGGASGFFETRGRIEKGPLLSFCQQIGEDKRVNSGANAFGLKGLAFGWWGFLWSKIRYFGTMDNAALL
jgi:hypothetical protein